MMVKGSKHFNEHRCWAMFNEMFVPCLTICDSIMDLTGATMPAKSLGTPLQILPCFAISPSPPQNNVVLWSKNRHDRTIRDSAGMLGQ